MSEYIPHGFFPEDVAKFWSRVDKTEFCWLWTGSLSFPGYGIFTDEYERRWSAHRYSYVIEKGIIPKEFLVDHLCRNSTCVRPDHLEAVLPVDNVGRGRVKEENSLLPHTTKAIRINLMLPEELYGFVERRSSQRYMTMTGYLRELILADKARTIASQAQVDRDLSDKEPDKPQV